MRSEAKSWCLCPQRPASGDEDISRGGAVHRVGEQHPRDGTGDPVIVQHTEFALWLTPGHFGATVTVPIAEEFAFRGYLKLPDATMQSDVFASYTM